MLGKAGRCSEPLQLPQIPQLELYSWDKVVGMKNSSYKKRPSRGADPAGPAVRSAAEPPVGWRATQEHAERASLALYFYNKTGTGRMGLHGRLRDRGYLQRGNFTSGNISSLRSPRRRMLKYYGKKKSSRAVLPTPAWWEPGPRWPHFPGERRRSCRCSRRCTGVGEPARGADPASLRHMVRSCLARAYASPDAISTLTCVK